MTSRCSAATTQREMAPPSETTSTSRIWLTHTSRRLRRLLDGKPSGAYNLGTGNGYSVREVLEAISR